MERPTSRRGVKSEIHDFKTFSNINKTETPDRNLYSRSSSSSLMSNRFSNTMPHFNSAVGSNRLNTSLSTNSFVVNNNNMDRPVTQQGIAAMRPNSTRGVPQIMRQIQDKRYYEGLVQLKIRELVQEISNISKEVDLQVKQRVTFLHYDQRAKGLASELIELQSQLADYNIVVDKMTVDTGKSFIEQEATELSQINDIALSEIETMFNKRQRKEKHLLTLEKAVVAERSNTEKIVENMNQIVLKKYNELCEQKIKLQKHVDEMQYTLDNLSSKKLILEENIALSQIKQEAVKLQSKIMEISKKRNTLREEDKKRLSPEEEKKSLFQKVKQDNTDITVSERHITAAKKRIMEIEQEIEQLDSNVDASLSEKLVKYKELRKREEVMEEFMASFKENETVELKKFKELTDSVTSCLEHLSREIDGELELSENRKLEVLNSTYTEFNNINNDLNLKSMEKEFFRLNSILLKIRNFNKQLRTELFQSKQNIEKYNRELMVLGDLDSLKVKLKESNIELLDERNQLKEHLPNAVNKLELLLKQYDDVKLRLLQNDNYSQVVVLEEKFKKATDKNENISAFIFKERERLNYNHIKKSALSSNVKYNSQLINSVRSIY
ncbi:intraflagellar transport protein 74 homolog [Leptopilina heterotoma]|uniref:intraflagellar transport protein 74 homolog n=1 Tax=Leptopilina heterotoma TaxID=63436 RepID=UPI001CA995A1|nr:intraflagellar transport protein 74 homolog [Leptopilina heterotoma]